MEGEKERDYLKRLPRHYYRGAAWVHWTMTIKDRRTGWLDDSMHVSVREALCHTMSRYHMVCAVYSLIPDHAHFLWCGCSMKSDQLNASSFFRRQWNAILRKRGFELQKQAYDNILRGRERETGAFEDTCVYVMKNPERGGLVDEWREWGFCGSLTCGYPRLDPREDHFWSKFWTIYNELRDPETL